MRPLLVSTCAKLAWFIPLGGMTLVGLSDQNGLKLGLFSSQTAVILAVTAAVLGIGLGLVALLAIARFAPAVLQLHAKLGIVAGVLLFAVTTAAALAGNRSGSEFQRLTRAALRDYPSFNGGVRVGNAFISAVQIDEHSEFGKHLLASFRGRFPVVLLTIDNSQGSHEVVVDLDTARVVLAGEHRPALSRAELSAEALHGTGEIIGPHLGKYRVPPGLRIDDALLLLHPPDPMPKATGIEVIVDGRPVVIPGRYFSVEQKRTIDEARAAAATGGSR